MPQSIDNVGSTARDHLANERTFLAWTRTGLGLTALGVALVQLIDSEGTLATIGGVLMVLSGIFAMAYGTLRYQEVRRGLMEGRYPVAKWEVLVMAAIVILAGLGGIFLLVN